ncbi:interferon-induced very large GTPase 1-like [Malaclemys terrapin pileata]|uniref:interferon-induced very large GTPase 1-like n=1 Tax=Malaclemys terrapin pileata TaxID=2991368 RepID=UPI0023A85614|nr:interferon-induced very large GTPase 1-like [Malaclemys terrapin pileata]XP_053878352.1 interferon-induced very large GTPase 1-like [Malaclemys terrapin pileata]XP_053878353.1 interferon-induced very large GTPase 1-like [Malaclemys terrapin pileata]XP_053878354.1 interferon-induced very large GTPase 1-like [Malaclemys terrapin pileata]XP_053878355.1 interferon-induced very large GTPase 1-like [Malaclemys terrapin pileata]XP_053878356.1 interferon-induced very large GTPase 1-like [Malaclemys
MSTGKEKPQNSAQEDPAKDELAKRLEAVGLSAEHWLPKLHKQLGVTSTQALKHLRYEDYLKLECDVQHTWEKQALQELLKTDSKATMKQLQEQHLEMLKKRQEQAKSAVKELEEMQEKGRSRHEEVVRKKEEELQGAMDIAPEYWAPHEKPLKEVIENVHKQLDLLEESVSQSENLPDKEVLRWASGGLALQGIYKTNKLAEMVEKREQLIDIPEGFELFGPQQGPLFEKKEFSSAEAESSFTRTMEKLGISIAAKGEFSAETSTDYGKSEESKKTHRSCSEHAYICTTQYSYIPLASCYFPKDQLRLSRAALQELKESEQLLSHTPEPDKLNFLKSRGGRFFKRFGSHVNQGPLHLGGIFWWKVSSEGFRAEQLDEVKKQTSDALSSYVGGSYGGFGWSISAGVTASKSGSEASFQGTDRKQTQTEIQLFVTKTGGPPGVDSLTAWKSGLLASNKTWSVIDRGAQLIPVWDIILSNHRQDFKDVYQMSSSLIRAYEALTNLSVRTLLGEELASTVDEARSFLEDMKSWEVSGDEEHLVTLMNFKQKLNEKTRSSNVWINLCLSDKVLQDFLEKTVSLCKDLSAPNEKYIKSLLRCLLDPYIYSVKHFPKSSFIMQWIFQSAEEQAEQICTSDLTDFIKVLQQMESEIKEATAASMNSPAAQQEAKRKATLILSLSFHSLLQALRDRAQTDTELLLLSVAASAGYRVESHTFQNLLGCTEINFMLKEIQRAHEGYLTLRDQDISRAQAFLLLTGLTVAAKNKVMAPEEKKKCLTFIKDHMQNSLSQEVTFVLTKHRALTDWKALERDLNFLVNGNFEAINDDQQKEYIKKELENVFQEIKPVNSPVSTSKEVQSSDTKTYEFPQNSGFLKLIQRLKLENYYPNKMGMADFQIIHKTSLLDSYPSNESELSFYFLDKLLMLDYRVRYLICKVDRKTKQGIANIMNTRDDVDEPLDNLDDIFNGDEKESNEFAESNEGQVHPMDIQMAIFHCADDFMRQYISTKLSLCQFALPLLVPDPCTSQIEFPLWSFCQVNKKWQSHEEFQNKAGIRKCKDQLIYHADLPVVSFIRFGASSFSKSQLLNTLLSKQKHSIFFHRHCRGSIKNCILMEGVVEIAWYCPGRDNDDDSFDNCIAFTNLHGDAREHEQQIKFLQEIASVTVVLLSDTDRNEKGTKVLQDLLKSPKPFIFLCIDKERISVNKSGKRVKIAVKNQSESKLMEELTTAIKCAVETSNIPCSLGKCANIAQEHGFRVDKDKGECTEGKKLAEEVMVFLKQENILDTKDKLLPLQGEFWHKWCKKDKERTHLQDDENMGIEQHLSQIKSEKHSIRQAQLQRAFPLNKLMQLVLSALTLPSHKTKLYFLQWLKVFIADLSADHLPELHRKYHDLWSQNQRGGNNDLQKQLEKLSHEINESTFGLKHLLREVGQIYEALDALPEPDKCFLELPKIVADLMVQGYPIELLDGDTSYVPLKWVGAIFDKLIEKLGDQKVFVLSVLGIQSTGKSTLLNAMFGLQFSVSAGRCTRGAFMQLVKVDDELREELNFDFMVVIDTEGLRAIELENRSALSHDNELATFVIGLGNTTLINIFGENPSEMQDILQIAVQAFLRMKKVNLSPSCLFVHQNVGDITANEKNMEGRRRLQEKLDEMAVIAAQQEFCDVTCFSDVIQFDVNTHIHYFPHLWEGDPPMAPPNPSYSQRVQELKREILMAAKEKSKQSFLRLSELKTRTQDLWEALLNENFVFSFKNTQEIVVYSRLENNYNKWTWELRSFMLNLQNKLNVQIQNGKISKIDRVDLEKRVQEKYDATEKDLERYFREDKDCNILIQWENNIKTKMNLFRLELIDKICQKCQELISLKNCQSSFEQRKSTYKDELLRKSKELARHFRDKELSESELRDRFIRMWKEWVIEVSSAAPRVEEPNFKADMEIFLYNHFKSEHNIRNRITTSSEWTHFPLNPSEHISMKRKWYGLKQKTTKECDVENLKTMTTHLEHHIYEYIENKASKIMNYTSSYFHEIVELISRKLESDSEDDNFTLTRSYKVDVSLYLCQMATRKFSETFKAFQKSDDPVQYLESKREEFFTSFKIACQGATSITTFADILCSNLKSAICHAVYDKTAIDIANEMRSKHPAFNGNRSTLELFMLGCLLKQEDFEKYQQYIYNPSYYMEDFIRREVDRYCLDKKNPKLKNFLNLNLDSFQTLVLSSIHESTKVVKDKQGNVASWLDEFCTRLGGDMYLPRSNLTSIEHQETKDIQFLIEVVSESLIPALEQLKQTFSEIDLDPFVTKPHQILFEQFSGCWKQCPFCKAVCTNTIPGHDGDHSTPCHRPQALAGIQWEETNHLVIDICTSLVASDCKIVLDGKIISCRNYREVGRDYANWDIKPVISQLSYWKWFVSHFRSDLEKIHDGKFEGKGAIPTDWNNLNKDEVLVEMLLMRTIFDVTNQLDGRNLCLENIEKKLQLIFNNYL